MERQNCLKIKKLKKRGRSKQEREKYGKYKNELLK
jgi:hypothetical protein